MARDCIQNVTTAGMQMWDYAFVIRMHINIRFSLDEGHTCPGVHALFSVGAFNLRLFVHAVPDLGGPGGHVPPRRGHECPKKILKK